MPRDYCIFQLLSIVHEINSSLDCDPTIDIRGVFLDISKALDKASHEGLLFKLETYAAGGELLNLFKDYLQVSSVKWSVLAHLKPQPRGQNFQAQN